MYTSKASVETHKFRRGTQSQVSPRPVFRIDCVACLTCASCRDCRHICETHRTTKKMIIGNGINKNGTNQPPLPTVLGRSRPTFVTNDCRQQNYCPRNNSSPTFIRNRKVSSKQLSKKNFISNIHKIKSSSR